MKPRITLVWRGDPSAPKSPTRYEERLAPVMDALRAAGCEVGGFRYFDDRLEDARAQLLHSEGVLVWINPIAAGRNRTQIDALLKEARQRGAWVSAHPDVIAKMGVKEVLYRTRDLSWGSDCELHASRSEFERAFPAVSQRGPRVLKPLKGNDGEGVMRVERAAADLFDIQHAATDARERMSLSALTHAVASAFDDRGRLIDQEWHPTQSGMVRCYMSGPAVVGFSIQLPRGPGAFGMQSSKEMHDATYAPLADLKELMEAEWTPQMLQNLGLAEDDLPAIWDADFLWRAPAEHALIARSHFALCEINVSCVSPFPPNAPKAIAAWVLKRTKAQMSAG